MKTGIFIEPVADAHDMWRAYVHVPRCVARAPGVKGGATEAGPWVEGLGATPEEALDAVLRAAGLALVSVMTEEDADHRDAEPEQRLFWAHVAGPAGFRVAVVRAPTPEDARALVPGAEVAELNPRGPTTVLEGYGEVRPEADDLLTELARLHLTFEGWADKKKELAHRSPEEKAARMRHEAVVWKEAADEVSRRRDEFARRRR